MSFLSRIALGALVLASAPHAGALTLGEHHGLSRLGSPLAVDIPVLGIEDGAEGLRADVPRYSEHARLGSPQPIAPQGVNARVLMRPDGRAVVRLESPDGVMEPVLRFLVRLRWSGGQAVREYEMLLDPPSYTPRRAAPQVRAPQLSGQISGQVRGKISAPQAPAPAVPRARLAAPPAARPPARAGQRYGPVALGDSLYSIVKRAYPARGADFERVANAVFSANLQAFAGGNRDRLMQGAFLTLPSDSGIDAAGSGSAIPTAAKRQPSAKATPAGERFASVRPGDSLFAIARRVSAAPEAEIANIARQLFAANPHAFIGNDMNRLMAGATLRVDGVSTASAPALARSEPAGTRAAAVTSSAARPTASLTMDGSLMSGLRETLVQERSRASELRSTLAASRSRLDALQQQQEDLSRQLEEKNAAIEQALASLSRPAAKAPEAVVQPPENAVVTTPAPAAATTLAPVQAAAVVPAQATSAPTTSPGSAQGGGFALETLLDGRSLTSPPVLGGLAALLASLLGGVVLLRRRRTDAQYSQPGYQTQGETIQQRLADDADDEEAFPEEAPTELHIGTDSADLEFTQSLDDDAAHAGAGGPDNVVRTGSARANDMAKQAAISIAYEDYATAQHYIDEAIRLEPHRDEHKMVLLTIHECMGEHDRARELMDDLMARKEQMSGAVRAQVEQMSKRQRT